MSLDKYTAYKTVLAVNAIVYCDGKFLMNKRSTRKDVDGGLYSGIGGKVEPGEDFYSAMIRELKEETGITEFESIRPYSISQHPYPPTESEWVNVYFFVTLAEQIEVPSTEDGEFLWMTADEIMKVPTPTDVKLYLKELVKNPNAFILGFHNHDNKGKSIEETVRVY